MLKLSKKVEYGILSMQYLASNQGQLFTAKSMSEQLNLSYEFLAKTLQKLMKNDLVKSQQGSNGGYYLNKPANDISIYDIICALDSKPELVECLSEDPNKDCDLKDTCLLYDPVQLLQKRVENVFIDTKLSDIIVQNLVEVENLNIRG